MNRGLTTAAAGLVLAGPRLLARNTPAAAGAAAGAVAGTARAGVRTADFAARATRAARAALPGAPQDWRAGRRAHMALRAETDADGQRGEHGEHGEQRSDAEAGAGPSSAPPRSTRTEHRARRLVTALAEHPDIALAYWDQGLGRLVVTAAEGVATERVVERVSVLAERYGLVAAGQDVEELAHPGAPGSIRTAGVALAADAVGVAAAFAGSALRLPASPRPVTAVVTLLRENPRFRGWLRGRLGDARMDVALAVVNAAVHGAGHSPTSLLLDGTLRTCQLAEAVVRTATFEAVHDDLCVPDRDSVPVDLALRPPPCPSPAQEYAGHASAGSIAGAVAALLVKHDVTEAAEAVLAGSPKAARYGPAAFHAVLSATLSRSGVLVRDPDRLRRLETVGTVLLHPSALRTPGAGADPGRRPCWTRPGAPDSASSSWTTPHWPTSPASRTKSWTPTVR